METFHFISLKTFNISVVRGSINLSFLKVTEGIQIVLTFQRTFGEEYCGIQKFDMFYFRSNFAFPKFGNNL